MVEIPPGSMHSFTSSHNAVRWRLVVRGTPDHWPEFSRIFPVVVFPPDDEAKEPSPRPAGTGEASRSREVSR